jgi:hypothetical protein
VIFHSRFWTIFFSDLLELKKNDTKKKGGMKLGKNEKRAKWNNPTFFSKFRSFRSNLLEITPFDKGKYRRKME